MGESRTPAGFPLFSKPAGGKITRHLRKTTKDLGKTTKHFDKTTRHFVFRGCYLGILPDAGSVTKKAIKPHLNIVYIKNVGLNGKERAPTTKEECLISMKTRIFSIFCWFVARLLILLQKLNSP